MPKPLIGLTSYPRDEQDRFTIPARYIEAVERAKGIPAVMPPTTDNLDGLFEKYDGIVLTGGADVCPSEYGGRHHESVYGVNKERDKYELALARALAEQRMPTLAICRGIQVFNVALGGTLVEHIPNEYGESISHRDENFDHVMHAISIDPSSRLASIVGATDISSPSFHHQSVRVPAPGFKVCAKSDDGVIEAIESDEHPNIIAIQWHPEYVAEKDPIQQGIFDQLINWAAR